MMFWIAPFMLALFFFTVGFLTSYYGVRARLYRKRRGE